MTGKQLVEDLDATDGTALAAAADLLAQSVPESIAGLVPYHASGYPAYLKAALDPCVDSRTMVVRVVLDANVPIAVADWRILDTQLFLNGLAVAPQWQRRGVGRALLDDGLALAQQLGVKRINLDVAAENKAATKLYGQLGFEKGSSAYWCDLSSNILARRTAPYRALDWPRFRAHVAAYGFGDLSIRVADNGEARIRIVGNAIRIESNLIADPRLLAYGSVLGAQRVLTVAASPLASRDSIELGCFLRMVLSIS